jgi:hypothetical protein
LFVCECIDIQLADSKEYANEKKIKSLHIVSPVIKIEYTKPDMPEKIQSKELTM